MAEGMEQEKKVTPIAPAVAEAVKAVSVETALKTRFEELKKLYDEQVKAFQILSAKAKEAETNMVMIQGALQEMEMILKPKAPGNGFGKPVPGGEKAV